ncbi:MAG TPA: hypothetical protein RMH99_09530 [Sandaracinaceae bacterium LLY-WYZ-13_1]|nr:hypothetical protein [Sandaracinaceae bacterium LLY-WYZ-13_1]
MREALRVDATDALTRTELPIPSLLAGRDRMVRRDTIGARPNVERHAVDGPHLSLQTRPKPVARLVTRSLARA